MSQFTKTTKVVKPTVMADALLSSSTVAETDYAAWSNATTYAIGDKVILTSTHRIYESLRATNLDHNPATDASSPPYWLDIGPTNRWAMFDNKVGTKTTGTTSITYVLTPGNVAGLGMMELVGREVLITMKDVTGGTTIYDRTIDLDGTIIGSVYDWFFTPYEQLTDLVLTDLPWHFGSPELTIVVTSSTGTPVECGVCKFGEVIEVGIAKYGTSIEILDFSRKETDAFGNIVLVERAFSKRITLPVVTEKADFNRIFRRLAAFRATPCIYIATEAAGYEPLIAYGFFRNFGINIEYPNVHQCDLTVESLI